MREVVAVAVRVVLRSNQAGSIPVAQEGLVPCLVDLAEKDLVDRAERGLVVREVWVQGDLVVPEFRLVLASGVRCTLPLFLLPDPGFDLARNQMAVDHLACWEEGPLMEDLQVVAKVDLPPPQYTKFGLMGMNGVGATAVDCGVAHAGAAPMSSGSPPPSPHPPFPKIPPSGPFSCHMLEL